MSFEEVSCILVLAATILRLLLSTRHILETVPVVVRFLFLEVFRGLVVDSKVFFGVFKGLLWVRMCLVASLEDICFVS